MPTVEWAFSYSPPKAVSMGPSSLLLAGVNMVAISSIWLISSDESEFEREREPELARSWEPCWGNGCVRASRSAGCLASAAAKLAKGSEDLCEVEMADRRPPGLGDTDVGIS